VYTACGASGFSFGLILGGLMTELGWRYTFLLPVPFALAILILAPRVLRPDETQRRPDGSFDIPGAYTSRGARGALVDYGFTQVNDEAALTSPLPLYSAHLG